MKRRAVFFIGGFDPKSPEAFYSRMDRENTRFETLWDAQVSRTPLKDSFADISCSQFIASGIHADDQWSTQTDFHFLTLDDIVLKDFSLPLYKRVLRYLYSFGDYTFTGTGFKFTWHSWRFALYALYPMVMLIASLALSLMAYSWAGSIDWSYPSIGAGVAFLACLGFCYQFVLKRGHVLHLMDLWSFSTEYLYRRRPDMDDKLDRFADQIFQATSSGEYDEVLTIGHSTGGALILDAAARVLERHPEYVSCKTKLTVLTVGSTALKVGLHPFAGWYRDRLKNLFATTPTHWMEWQCVTDLINFHRTDPSKLMGFESDMQVKMRIDNIRIKAMVSPEIYQRMKNNYFRVHYQFVYGNTKKNLYDFPAICFEPVTLVERVKLGPDLSGDNPYLSSLSGKTPEKT